MKSLAKYRRIQGVIFDHQWTKAMDKKLLAVIVKNNKRNWNRIGKALQISGSQAYLRFSRLLLREVSLIKQRSASDFVKLKKQILEKEKLIPSNFRIYFCLLYKEYEGNLEIIAGKTNSSVYELALILKIMGDKKVFYDHFIEKLNLTAGKYESTFDFNVFQGLNGSFQSRFYLANYRKGLIESLSYLSQLHLAINR